MARTHAAFLIAAAAATASRTLARKHAACLIAAAATASRTLWHASTHRPASAPCGSEEAAAAPGGSAANVHVAFVQGLGLRASGFRSTCIRV